MPLLLLAVLYCNPRLCWHYLLACRPGAGPILLQHINGCTTMEVPVVLRRPFYRSQMLQCEVAPGGFTVQSTPLPPLSLGDRYRAQVGCRRRRRRRMPQPGGCNLVVMGCALFGRAWYVNV
jgi:hypothetical protein